MYGTHLDEKEKTNVNRMSVFERDVASTICCEPLPLADQRYTLCNVAHDGRLNRDGLGVD